jgi:elongation factor Tu-like protein
MAARCGWSPAAARATASARCSNGCSTALPDREQAATIDAAYRSFATPRRNFILADLPGHEQDARNLITAASTADLAVNMMDLADYAQTAYDRVVDDWQAFSARIARTPSRAIPVCASTGDNVVQASVRMPWYAGGPVLDGLETAPIDKAALQAAAFRMRVQGVTSRGGSVRGDAGVDGRRTDAAGGGLPHADRHADGDRDRGSAQAPHRRPRAGAGRRHAPRAGRHRRGALGSRPRRPLRGPALPTATWTASS